MNIQHIRLNLLYNIIYRPLHPFIALNQKSTIRLLIFRPFFGGRVAHDEFVYFQSLSQSDTHSYVVLGLPSCKSLTQMQISALCTYPVQNSISYITYQTRLLQLQYTICFHF